MPSKVRRTKEGQLRKRRLRAALGLRGMNQERFARVVGVKPGHLSAVLNERRESGRLTTVIDQFIAEHLPTASSAA